MKSSVYFSSERIEVIGYEKNGSKTKILDYAEAHLPEGSMINGKIIDIQAISEALKTLKEGKEELFKDVELVIDGNSLFMKKLDVPKLTVAQYKSLIADEYADNAESFQDLICDYHMLQSKDPSKLSMLACATDKTIVESYFSVFEGAGIKLSKIRMGVEAVINYVEQSAELSNSSFVLNIIDGITMISMIFDKGINVFISRTRLFYMSKEEMIRRLHENLSGLMQFNRSQKLDDVTTCYYLGLNHEELELLKETSPYYEVNSQALPLDADSSKVKGKDLSKIHFVYLATLLDKNGIDLVKSYQMLLKSQKSKDSKSFKKIAAIGLAAVVVASIGVTTFKYVSLSSTLKDVKAYVENPLIQAKSEEIDQLLIETNKYVSFINEADSYSSLNEQYLPITGDLLDLVKNAYTEKVEVIALEFDQMGSVIKVNGLSATEKDSAVYVEALKINPLVKNVYYTGYSYTNGNMYNFSIEIDISNAINTFEEVLG